MYERRNVDMTRISDLGELYDDALKVLKDSLETVPGDRESAEIWAIRASTAMQIVRAYLDETRQNQSGG